MVAKRTMENIQLYLDDHYPGSKVLDYVNRRTRATFECAKGHRFMAFTDNLKRSWCRLCFIETLRMGKDYIQQYIDGHHPGGRILGDYINMNTKTTFRCEKGHKFVVRPGSIIHSGSWCRWCSLNMYTKEDIQKFIDDNHPGGEIIGNFINTITKATFQCKTGHTWTTLPSSIMKGFWCSECKHQLKKEEIQQYIDDNHPGGKLLSYENTFTPARFQCEKGHQWKTRWQSIQNGNWCHLCKGHIAGHGGTFDEQDRIEMKAKIQEFINQHHPGGKILGEYVNTRTPTLFQCEKGHTWTVPPHNIIHGNWCAPCRHHQLSKEDIQHYIDTNHLGGKIIGDYINNYTHTSFQCEHGHKWKATCHSITQGSWCPDCWKHDKISSDTMESISEKYAKADIDEICRYTLSSAIDLSKCGNRSRKTVTMLTFDAHPPDITTETRQEHIDDYLKIITEIIERLPELLDDRFRIIVKNEIYRIEQH